MWVRGLKQSIKIFSNYVVVAPYVGAWIETSTPNASDNFIGSHPMWVRGLKQSKLKLLNKKRKSHPMWVRGLKL